jgi:hypothetical protein
MVYLELAAFSGAGLIFVQELVSENPAPLAYTTPSKDMFG